MVQLPRLVSCVLWELRLAPAGCLPLQDLPAQGVGYRVHPDPRALGGQIGVMP